MTVYTNELGQEFELPKLTIKLADEMEDVPNKKGFKETAKAMYDFIKKLLPKDYLKGYLDGDNLDNIDIVNLRKLYDGVNAAYTDALGDGQMQNMVEKLEDMAPMLESLEKLVDLNEKASARQGFTRVK